MTQGPNSSYPCWVTCLWGVVTSGCTNKTPPSCQGSSRDSELAEWATAWATSGQTTKHFLWWLCPDSGLRVAAWPSGARASGTSCCSWVWALQPRGHQGKRVQCCGVAGSCPDSPADGAMLLTCSPLPASLLIIHSLPQRTGSLPGRVKLNCPWFRPQPL